MIKIEFGYSNDKNPKGSWEGIHISPDLLLLSADYYGAIELGDKTYIVAKVVEDEHNRYPELLDNFIVREALVDLYRDGSGILFLDQKKSAECEQIERFLNSPHVKDKIKDHKTLIKECREIGVHFPFPSFSAIEQGHEKLVSTSITHEAFDDKYKLLKNSNQSMSDMQRRIEKLTRQLEETRKPNIR